MHVFMKTLVYQAQVAAGLTAAALMATALTATALMAVLQAVDRVHRDLSGSARQALQARPLAHLAVAAAQLGAAAARGGGTSDTSVRCAPLTWSHSTTARSSAAWRSRRGTSPWTCQPPPPKWSIRPCRSGCHPGKWWELGMRRASSVVGVCKQDGHLFTLLRDMA